MPRASRATAVAATAGLLLSAAVSGVVAPAAAEAPAPPEPPPAAVIDDGGARSNPVDPATLPPGLLDRVPAVGGKAVEDLRTDGSSGFRTFHPRSFAYGAYRLQLVDSGSDGNIESLRTAAAEAAAHLTASTNLTFTLEGGRVARPATVNRFGSRFCGSFGGHRCSLFGDGEEEIGIIRIEFASGSPCGPLVPSGVEHGTVGCGGPESARRADGAVLHVRGNVWVSPSLQDANRSIAADVVAHEIGHALGLDHYDGTFTAVPGGVPVRQLMYSAVHEDPTDTGLRYRSGDANGLHWLQLPDTWFIAATYRDFLGRIPDTAGFQFWAESDVTPVEYVNSLASSDEWIGRILTDFYADVFERAPDPAGFAYWAGLVRSRGVPFVAAQLYGSDEYLARQGGTVEGFVGGLYRALLGRDPAADAAGVAFWVATAGQRGRVSVAHDFFQSEEKRRRRVHDLYCTLLDRPPDPGGQAYWAGVILTQGDLALARHLATSDEYVQRADEFTLLPLDQPPAC